MQLQDSDIIFAARDLRDEQNEQLYVAPSPLKGRRTPTPLWWAATAAALVVGFFVGKGLPSGPTPTLPVREGAITLEDSHLSHSQNHSAPSLIGRAGGESGSGLPFPIKNPTTKAAAVAAHQSGVDVRRPFRGLGAT